MLPNISTATVHRWGTGHKRCPARARRANVPPKPHVTSGTTKTVVPKIPKTSGSTPTPCLDKAVLAQGGGGVVIAVTLVIRGNGSNVAYFLHNVGTAHNAPR